MANVLITGGSGYLGGSLLANLTAKHGSIPEVAQLYALVRNEEQANNVKKHFKAEPLIIDLADQASITKTLTEKRISVIFFLIDAFFADVQKRMIKGLEQVQQETGLQTHFLHTTGAKFFSSHAGFPTEPSMTDADETLYDVQNGLKAKHTVMQGGVGTNNAIVDTAITHGVRAYILAPCIVYGKGEGFGNKISIQTVAIVKAAEAARRVYRTDQGRPIWPVCHISDQTSIYVHLLRKIVSGQRIGYNKQGYYLASSGLVAWDDIYASMAKALAKRGIVDDDRVVNADQGALRLMAHGIGCSESQVALQLGGLCTWRPAHAENIGWKAQYKAKHIIEAADEEVELILQNIRRACL